MQRVTIDKKIYLEPQFLNENLVLHISKSIKDQILGKCDKNNGYILKIYDNISILGNKVSSSGSGVYFNVRIDVKTLMPKIGGVYEGVVCFLFCDGIFVEVHGKMKILIRIDSMNGYKYNKIKNIFKKDTKTIAEGDKVEISINMVKYEKQNFNCIGNLKTN
jgi:DNA-directed RNA polymerase subunit E'/Rpb7